MDIDGTLVTGSEPELENVNRQLSRLAHHRIKFSVATGRTVIGARAVVKSLGPKGRAPLIIAYNGAVVADLEAKPWMYRTVIDNPAFLSLLEVCRDIDLSALVYTCADRLDIKGDQERVFTESHLLGHAATEFNGMPITIMPRLERLVTEDIVAVLVWDPSGRRTVTELRDRLTQRCGSFLRITTSGGRYVEIAHPRATKRHAMGTLCARLGIAVSDVMAIGDNFNDLEMLAECGCGVAVANSPQAVKDACSFVCKQDAARGVVEALMAVASACREKARRRKIESNS